MKMVQPEKNQESTTKKWQGILVGLSFLLILMGFGAVPIPALLEEIRFESQIENLKKQHLDLISAWGEIEKMERDLPSALKGLIGETKAAFPNVESLLALRNLLLAQAWICGIGIEYCVFSEACPLGLEILDGERPSGLGRIEMEVRGSAPLKNLILFVGLLESTRLAYTVKGLEIRFASSEMEGASFHLDLAAAVRMDPEGMGKGSPVGDGAGDEGPA